MIKAEHAGDTCSAFSDVVNFVVGRTQDYEYCRKRGLYPDAESYPWKSNAHYWLVTNLYQNMRANALADAELRRKAADELTCMTARINRGETIPEPVKQLPVMGGRPLNRAQALAKIAEIKAKFGLKGASV